MECAVILPHLFSVDARFGSGYRQDEASIGRCGASGCCERERPSQSAPPKILIRFLATPEAHIDRLMLVLTISPEPKTRVNADRVFAGIHAHHSCPSPLAGPLGSGRGTIAIKFSLHNQSLAPTPLRLPRISLELPQGFGFFGSANRVGSDVVSPSKRIKRPQAPRRYFPSSTKASAQLPTPHSSVVQTAALHIPTRPLSAAGNEFVILALSLARNCCTSLKLTNSTEGYSVLVDTGIRAHTACHCF